MLLVALEGHANTDSPLKVISLKMRRQRHRNHSLSLLYLGLLRGCCLLYDAMM